MTQQEILRVRACERIPHEMLDTEVEKYYSNSLIYCIIRFNISVEDLIKVVKRQFTKR